MSNKSIFKALQAPAVPKPQLRAVTGCRCPFHGQTEPDIFEVLTCCLTQSI